MTRRSPLTTLIVGFLTFIPAAIQTLAQSPQWSLRFDDVAYAQDAVTEVVTDADGTAYVAGYNDTGWTAWKIAPGGTVVWHWHQAGLLRQDEEPRIAGLDADRNLYLVSGSNYGITLARVAADGQSANVRQHAEGRASIRDATMTLQGDVFMTGSFREDEYQHDAYVFVARFDRDGEIVWGTTYAGPASDLHVGTAIEVAPGGDIYVAGQAAYRSETSGALCHAGLVLRYSPTGALVWDSLTIFNPAAQMETLNSATLAVDSVGNAYVAGWESSTGQNFGLLFSAAADGAPLWRAGPFERLYTVDEGRNPVVLLDQARGAVYLASDARISDTDSDFRLRGFTLGGANSWTVSYDGPAHARDNLQNAGVDIAGRIHLIGTSYAAEDNPDLTDVLFDHNGQLLIIGRSDNEASKYDRVRAGAVATDGSAWIVGGAFSQHFDSRLVRLTPGGQVAWTMLLQTIVGSADVVGSLAVDAGGGIYVVGESDRRLVENQGILMRYSASGVLQWQQRLPIDFRDPGAVLVDPHGNALVVTRFGSETAPLGLLKYAPDGTLIWSGHYPGPYRLSWLRGVLAMDSAGDLFICGDTDPYDHINNGIVTRVTADGVLVWSRLLGGPRYEGFSALAVSAAGETTVTGYSSQYQYNTPYEIVTIRYSRTGQEQWQHYYSDPDSTEGDTPVAVNLAADGGAFVTVQRGNFPVRFWTSVLCYSPQGALQWERRYRGTEDESVEPQEARIDSDGNLIVLCLLKADDDTSDVLVLCYAPDGTLRFAHRQAGPRNFSELGQFLEILSNGNLLISADLYPGPSYQYYNPMFLQLDSDGVPRWMSRHMHPGDLSGRMADVHALPDGGFVTTGWTWSPETRDDGVLTRFGPPPPMCPGADPCPGDLNADCRLDLADLAIVLSAFGNANAEGFAPHNGDVDLDGDVDLQDLSIVLSSWGSDCR